MYEQSKIIGLSFTLITIFILSFFNLYQSAKVEQNILGITHTIHRIRVQNILIHEQITNNFKNQNYDKLNHLVVEFSSNWDTLSKQIKTKFATKKDVMLQILKLDNSIKKARQLAIHYESNKAVLANSVFFLLKQESDVRHNSDRFSLIYSDLLSGFLKDILYYDIGLSQINEHIQQITSHIETAKISNRVNVEMLKQHLSLFKETSNRIHNNVSSINALNVTEQLDSLEKLFFEVVDYERFIRKYINLLMTLFFVLILLVFLIVFFKTHRDKTKILLLQKENEQKNYEIMEHMQLLNEYKKALDLSSIVSITNPNGTIIHVNDKFCTVSGYSREELLGQPQSIIRHDDVPKEFFNKLWKTIKAKKTFHGIIKNRKKNNDFYYVDSTILPILDLDGNITEYFAVRHDITELVTAREEALAAEKAKSAFLATMSHELRTPLNSVIGFSQIILAKEDISLQVVKEYIKKINISGIHLLNTLNNILDFSKIESGKMQISKTNIDLDALIDDTLTLVETSINAKDIKIEKYNFKGISLLVDEQLIKQIILNILSNAIKFTPQNKTITLSYKAEEGFNIISICDEGVGLTSEQIKVIFKPFSQIKEHQNQSKRGTGLGLAISKKIVELHNGTIEVESKVGIGSCFKISLPQSNNT